MQTNNQNVATMGIMLHAGPTSGRSRAFVCLRASVGLGIDSLTRQQ